MFFIEQKLIFLDFFQAKMFGFLISLYHMSNKMTGLNHYIV